MGKQKIFIILGGVVALLIIVAVVGKKQGWIGKGNATKVAVEKASLKTIVETVTASGKIFPEVEVKISPDVSGEITELHVEEGDSVHAGDLLAKIDPDIYLSLVERAEATLNNSKANLAQAKARLAQVQAQFINAESTFKRNKKLFQEKVISDADYETAETGFKTAEADLEAARQTVAAAEYTVKSTEAGLKEARDNLDQTILYAPMDGIVSMLAVEKGERVVGTAQMAGTEMMRIANMHAMEAQVDVSENDILSVSLHDTSIIEVDAYLDREFKGIVSEIANSANATNELTSDQVTNFKVKIRLLRSSYEDLLSEGQGRQYPFRPGMSASVEIQTEIAAKTLSVPLQSVTTREEKEDSLDNKEKVRELVFIAREGKAIAQDVSTGIQDDTYIQVLTGVEEGDEIISGPYSAISRKLEDGDDIEIVDKEDLFKEEEE